ncbi:MAG: nickel-dependent hydrogenase large subunit [Sulfolobaceae archaeon]
MSEKIISPFNRVEEDLDVKLIFDGKKVIDVKLMSRLFRGIEIILKDKSPMDALVITPRICGICGASHLYSAASALDMAYNAEVPANAIRLRNIMSMSEVCQNDIRHTYLMFLVDVINRKYKYKDFYSELYSRYAPFNGKSYIEAIKWSKKYTEVYSIFGGQWPHGSAIVPGGVTCDPFPHDIFKAISILNTINNEYIEKIVLGGPSEQFLETVKSMKDLDQWARDYKDGDISKIWTFGQELNWHKLGIGSNVLMSYGHLPIPEDHIGGYTMKERKEKFIFKSGLYFIDKDELVDFDQENIREFVTYSYYIYNDNDNNGLHPFSGTTQVIDPISSTSKYTFTKCFRYLYQGKLLAPEVGAIAMLTVAEFPLIKDLVRRIGSNVLTRLIARIVRVVLYNKLMIEHLRGYEFNKPTYKRVEYSENGMGFGLVEAARGSLGHWVIIKNGKIQNYQIVTPTQINMGPEDPFGGKSHVAMAIIGTEVEDENNPIEVMHIIRSHDSCMVCNVH